MSLLATAVLATSLLSQPTDSVQNGVVQPVLLPNIKQAFTFEGYKVGAVSIGYTLTMAQHMYLSDTTRSEGRRQVIRLHYTNRTAMNSFDILQTPARRDLTPEKSIEEAIKTKHFDVPTGNDIVFVAIRRGNTDVGLVGSMLSVPSAKEVLKNLEPIR